ncbi:MAG TPA: nucleoside triphosphate pyrophosphatase [Patescibacteria group bacterium]|nr:nucleoside triphosphate pyrophosphatase [Patescibacteria group bacterium]
MKQLILASSSPRRKELLEKAGFTFSVVTSNYEEDMSLPLSPEDLAKFLSLGKARSVAESFQNAVILGADTFVVLGDMVLGKPKDIDEAKHMLRNLSGKKHNVITGFSLIDTTNNQAYQDVDISDVYIKHLSEEDIIQYILTHSVLDKAGAYAIQDMNETHIERFVGEYDTVVGLPIKKITVYLQKFGIVPVAK